MVYNVTFKKKLKFSYITILCLIVGGSNETENFMNYLNRINGGRGCFEDNFL